LVRLFVDPPELAASLCAGGALGSQSSLQLGGFYGHGDEFPNLPLSLRWSQSLKPFRGRFFTVSHHGACEITDHCGVSPNSVETTRLADRTGANAIELDVRVTRDGVPLLFHDPALSSSLVRGLFCNGAIADLSLAELRANCTLRYGEALPTVEEALTAMIDETELEGVYLDVKVPEAILPTARLASQTLAALAQRNQSGDPSAVRRFGIIVAITNDENRAAWHVAKDQLAAEGLALPPCLVEYDPDLVLSEGCVAWGPTWTAGPRVADVERLRAAGAATIFWTLNQSDFIDQYLLRAEPDGIITARPALVFHRYQKIGTPPALPEGVVP
jgi:glycerophosphoryl diester phosphodiesterase